MTALIPNVHATASTGEHALPATPRTRRPKSSVWDGPPHAAAQLGAALAAVAFAWFAVQLLLQGFAWAALPVAVLALAILLGAFLPVFLADRYDRLRAAEEEQGAGA